MQSKTYSRRFVGSTERGQAGLSTEVLRFVQHFLHSLCDFIIGELDVGVTSSTLPAYSHIKPERQLRGSTLHDIKQRARSTPVKPLAMKAQSLDNCGAYLLLSLALNLCGKGCVLLSRSGRKPGKGFSSSGEVSLQ